MNFLFAKLIELYLPHYEILQLVIPLLCMLTKKVVGFAVTLDCVDGLLRRLRLVDVVR